MSASSQPAASQRPVSVLIIGGARSGKSRLAEGLAARWSPVRYVAPGHVPDPDEAADAEWAARIAAHRQRRPPAWTTIETADVPAALAACGEPLPDPGGACADGHGGAEPAGAVLVDCLGTWVTRLVDDAGAWADRERAEHVVHRAAGQLTAVLRELTGAPARPARAPGTRRTPGLIVLVTSETGLGVVPGHASGRLFRDLLGRVNEVVAAACDRVLLVVAGRVLDLSGAPAVDDAAGVLTGLGPSPQPGGPVRNLPQCPGADPARSGGPGAS